jgi:hypothetical protein
MSMFALLHRNRRTPVESSRVDPETAAVARYPAVRAGIRVRLLDRSSKVNGFDDQVRIEVMDESRKLRSVTRTTHDAEPRTAQEGSQVPRAARLRYSPRTDRMNRPATRYGS